MDRDQHEPQREVPADELIELALRHLAGELDEAGTKRLAVILAEDATNRDKFVQLCSHVQLLRSPLRLLLAAGAKPAQCAAGDPVVCAATPASRRGWRSGLRDFAREPLALVVLLLIMICGGVLIWKLPQLHRQQPPVAQQPPASPAEEPDTPPAAADKQGSIATLVRTSNAVWRQPTALKAGTPLILHEKLSLSAGLVEIVFHTGATVILEGPAELEIGSRAAAAGAQKSPALDFRSPVSANSCSLTLGKLVARVPKQAHGFTVHTPTMKIVDLGTEFGVEVKQLVPSTQASGLKPRASTEVQVFRGLVEVQAPFAQVPEAGGPPDPIRLKEGQGLTSVLGDQRPREIKVDESHFVRNLPGPPPVAARPKDSALQPGDIVVAMAQSDLKLVKIDPKSGGQSLLAEGTAAPVQQGDWWMSLACAPDGTVLVGTSETGHTPPRIMKVDPRDGKMSVLATIEKDIGTGVILGLAVTHDGSIIASVGDRIVRLDPAGGRQTVLARLGGDDNRICMDAGGKDLLIASMLKQSVSLLRGNKIIPWVEGAAVGRPLAVAVRGDGRVFVTSELGKKLMILEIERGASHAVRAVADLPEPSSAGYVGMGVENDGHLVVCSSSHPFSVYRVDVDRGTVTVLAQGGEIVLPIAMAVVPGAPVEPEIDRRLNP